MSVRDKEESMGEARRGDRAESVSTQAEACSWRARMDALATCAMIEHGGPNTVDALHSLVQEATQLDVERSRELITGFLAEMAQDPEAGAAHLLKGGLAELQAAFEAPPAAEARPLAAATVRKIPEEDAEMVAEFLIEAREHLAAIETQMLVLERDPGEMEVIHTVFRAFHTMKGLAAFLGFPEVQATTHELETLLDLARKGKLVVDSAVVDVVLESKDCLRADVAIIDASLNTGVPMHFEDNADLLARVRALAVLRNAPHQHLQAAEESHVEIDLAPTTPADLLEQQTSAAPAPEHTSPLPAKETPPTDPARASVPGKAARSTDASSVRVETSKLDHLMDMVGEIVIAQSLIRHNQVLLASTDSRLLADLSQLARVTVEVQRATMSMRMIPVGQLFQRVERVIRDLSRKIGKQVYLETAGTETGIDKTVAEELADPLLHMVRNSIDHGIEAASERAAAGKPAEARIRLSAQHQGGQVVIQISDDGRGLNAEKIRRKAEERQLIAPGAQLNDTEIYQLIFEPGFSTAEQVTDLSGRGVGMDVVRRNVEKLRGRIETQSVLGQGSTFLLKVPLTLAIIDGLVVEVGAERYIIPLSGVREIFRPTADTLFTMQGRDEMLLVRGDLMPVVRLHQRLGIPARAVAPTDGLIVVIELDQHRFCLLVDDLVGKQEVVIKSLGEAFKNVPGLSGCAVLGDGRVGLILDMDGIYRGRR